MLPKDVWTLESWIRWLVDSRVILSPQVDVMESLLGTVLVISCIVKLVACIFRNFNFNHISAQLIPTSSHLNLRHLCPPCILVLLVLYSNKGSLMLSP